MSVEIPSAGDSVVLGSMELEILGPVKKWDSQNNNSIVIRAVCGETSFLLMGDAEQEEEIDLLASGCDLSSDVLKVGHHGSATSSCMEFLQAVDPKYAAISVARDNNRLPSVEVLERFMSLDIQTIRTDVEGTIIFLSDGLSVKVMTENKLSEE